MAPVHAIVRAHPDSRCNMENKQEVIKEATKKTGVYACRLKPTHPTGVYQRGGFVFQVKQPTMIPAAQMTEQIRTDPWLIIME